MIKLQEVTEADALRARMVSYMCSNYADYKDLNIDDINADMPSYKRFESVGDRIAAMSNATEMVGELEIVTLTKILDSSIRFMAGTLLSDMVIFKNQYCLWNTQILPPMLAITIVY